MIEIRPIRPDEVALAHALEVRSYPEAEAASLARFEDRARRFPEGFLLLFERGELRALLSSVRTSVDDLGREEIKAEGGHDPAGHDLVILSVATDPAHRRRGLGGLLLAALALGAERAGVARIRLLCKDDKVRFYARHGYRYVGPSSSRHGGASWHEMERAPGLRDLRADRPIEVRPVAAAETRPLRQAILRPHQRVDELVLPGDDAPETLHAAAFDGERIVGVASVRREPAPPEVPPVSGDAWRLRGMATVPEERRRGVGRALFRACEAHARAKGGALLWLSARTGAIAFYRAMRCEVAGTEYDVPKIGPHVVMWKAL